MRFRCRQILVALACLALPLTIVAASGAHVRRVSLAHGYHKPNPSIFGVNTGTFDLNPKDYKKDFARARNMGARWVHFTSGSVHWTTSGKADYTVLDYGTKLAKAQGEGILISLGGDPKACSAHVPSPSNCPPTTSAQLKTYKGFLRQELTRYRFAVTYWESWVAANLDSHWAPKASPAQYAQLLKAQYSVFKAVNKKYHTHLQLLFADSSGFSLGPTSSNGMAVLPFAHQVLNYLKGYKAFDGVAVHGYRYPPVTNDPNAQAQDNVQGIPVPNGANGPYPNCTLKPSPPNTYCDMTWPEELTAYEQEFLNHGYGNNGVEPLWVTEFGWPGNKSVPNNPPGGKDYWPTFAQQKQDVQEAYRYLLSMKFVQGAFWFNLRDYDPSYPTCGSGRTTKCDPDPPFFAHYGLLQYGGTPKPAGYEFKSLSHSNPGR